MPQEIGVGVHGARINGGSWNGKQHVSWGFLLKSGAVSSSVGQGMVK